MAKATQIPSDKWEKRVVNGVDENGEKVYKTFVGDSKEDVDEQARKFARQKKLAQQNEWQKENMERVSVVFDKGTKERIQRLGGTINGFIRDAVEKELRRCGV